MSEFRTLAFGDLETATWGVTWLPGGEGPARLAVGVGGRIDVVEVSLQPGAAEEPWRLDGDGVSLDFRPEVVAPRAASAADAISTSDQLCSVSGQLRLGGTETDVACLGWRSSGQSESELEGLDSLRFVAAWLDPHDGFSLTSLRPRKARGQEADEVAAVVIEDPAPPAVDDPRLSTTYTADGRPLRAGLEMWFAEPSPPEGENGGSHPYPRRAAGEAAGPRVDWEGDGFDWHAALLIWRSHGHEGPGVYLLGRRR